MIKMRAKMRVSGIQPSSDGSVDKHRRAMG